jgi:beta-lactam-binding protein with PASTA domain
MPAFPGGGRRLLIAGGIVAIAAAGAAFALTHPDKVEVPGVVGQAESVASTTLEERGFDVETETRTDESPTGSVIEQDPEGGEEADEGATVSLVVSSGPDTAAVPDVKGLTEAKALDALKEAGFEPTAEETFSEKVPRGKAISTSPPTGTEHELGGFISLLISKGPRTAAVPDLMGLTAQEALSRLKAKKLSGTIEKVLSEKPAGTVFEQDPAAGERVRAGSTVTVSVAKAGVTVPDVSRQAEKDARTALDTAGLEVLVKYVKVPPKRRGLVVSQDPAAGTLVERGDTMEISVGSDKPGKPVSD